MQISSNPLIYLASASPRRSALLTQLGVPHRVRPVDIDESRRKDEHPGAYVQRLAKEKAAALWASLADPEQLPVLAADTTVALEDQILGKPRDEADAIRMLQLLSSRTHQVYTGVALLSATAALDIVSVSQVRFRALTVDEASAYWRTGEPADKAGAYAVQGLAAAFIQHIEGSYSGIMGLPLFETAQLLSEVGWKLGDASVPAKVQQ